MKLRLEINCYKGSEKGHLARNCTAKTCDAQEKAQKSNQFIFLEGEVNGQPVGRTQLDSGASRTIVNRRLISFTDIGKKSVVVTFGNETAGKQKYMPVSNHCNEINDEEYCLEAAVVQDLTRNH